MINRASPHCCARAKGTCAVLVAFVWLALGEDYSSGKVTTVVKNVYSTLRPKKLEREGFFVTSQ